LLAVSLAASLSLAEPAAPHVTQVLSVRQAKLGEPIRLDVSVTHPKGERWALETPADLGPFSVLGRKATTLPDGDQEATRLSLTLGLYEPGKHVVPHLTLREAASGRTFPLSEDAEVEAVSSLAKDDPGALRDVAPPRPLFFLDARKVLAAAGAGLTALALIALAARAAWRRLFPPESEEERDRRLLASLDALEDEPFYDALDGVVRRSLARWHGVPALERTAEEIAEAVAARPPPGVDAEGLSAVLREGVKVRFAHLPSSQARRHAALEVCAQLFPPEAPQKGGVRHVRPALS
jgi:hypothetical protein